jgi:octopine/nopaline transport system permease protein
MDFDFDWETLQALLAGVPLTLELAAISIFAGAIVASVLAAMRLSGVAFLDLPARAYVFVFRGTPLLVQLFLIYYGLSQFRAVRTSVFWPFLRDPFWCAVLALTLNTGAYASEIIRGGLLSVPRGQVEAARACGMSRPLLLRRIVIPLAIRQALPGYGNEIIILVKSTSLASIITLMEVNGIAAKIIAETYRAVEVFLMAGAIYLAITFALTRIVAFLEHRLTPYLRERPETAFDAAGAGGI